MAEVKTTGVPAEKPAASAIPASTTASATRTAPGLTFRRLFTKPGVSPYDEIEWEKRIAQITDSKGGVIFEQKDVEAPKDWSMTATNIVASKYLHGTLGTPERESGVRALVTRVAETIRDWGLAQGYFRTPEDGATFHDELAHILLRQYAAGYGLVRRERSRRLRECGNSLAPNPSREWFRQHVSPTRARRFRAQAFPACHADICWRRCWSPSWTSLSGLRRLFARRSRRLWSQ